MIGWVTAFDVALKSIKSEFLSLAVPWVLRMSRLVVLKMTIDLEG